MLDHGLEIVAYALKLRQSHLLPAGTTPEAQAAQAEAWTAGTAYAALLHDIGKVAVDLHVEYADGAVWHPWHGPLRRPYRFRYSKEREYRLHSAATGLLYTRLLDPGIFDWLAGYPDLWSALLYVLAGQYEHAGTLGELVVQADQASVAQELGGDWLATITLAGRRQLSWPVEIRSRAGSGGGATVGSSKRRRPTGCPARGSRTTKCTSSSTTATHSPRLPPRPSQGSANAAPGALTAQTRFHHRGRDEAGEPATTRWPMSGTPKSFPC